MGMEEFLVCVDRIIASSSSSSSSPSSSSSSPAAAAATGKVVAGASSVNHDNTTVAGRENILLIDTTTNKTDENGGLSFKINEQKRDGTGMILKLQDSEKGNNNGGGGESRLKGFKNGNLKECRICQEEDFEKDMEIPCACNGTLKFAHRKCIQRWCNKKGDITCEICNQIFSPNYILPPKKSNPDVMAIDIRQAWASNIDLRDPRFLAFAAAQHQFLQSDYEEYSIESSGAFAYFRMVVIALMLLLLVRQTLMITKDLGMLQESSTFFRLQIMLLQLAGFLLPCYVMARSVYIMQCRRRRQV